MLDLSKKINQTFIDEYKRFLKDYLFRLLGLVHCELTECYITQSSPDCIEEENGNIYFAAKEVRLFWIKKDPVLTMDNLRLAKVVIETFFSFSEYPMLGKYKRNNLFEKQRQSQIYNMAIQAGICQWITGRTPGNNAEVLFNVLERWSVKTYEGRNVTMGFVIDPEAVSQTHISFEDWISFLEDDYAAVISDCIHSVFMLDKNCNFIGYRSVSDTDKIPECELSKGVPLRFMHIIQQFVPKDPVDAKSNKVGIFLLSNGDILLAKDGVTRFVKRNMQWLNLSYDAFENALQSFIDEMYSPNAQENAQKLISSVYASVLDVSFSHTGGIISIVGPAWRTATEKGTPVDQILSFWDNLLLDDTSIQSKMNEVKAGKHPELTSEKKGDQKKKLLKRSIIRNLVHNKKFTDLDRKLRGELIALDGACILGLDGSIYSFGAIIQNDSGSTGGARAAAAKKLSQYGIAVKVSTDGYIELYIKDTPVYVVK